MVKSCLLEKAISLEIEEASDESEHVEIAKENFESKNCSEISHEEEKKLENMETSQDLSIQEIKEEPFDCRSWEEFKCELCKEIFNKIYSLDHHMNNKHARELNCRICKMKFKIIQDMNNHMDENHEGRWKMNDPDIMRTNDEESE